MFEEIELVTILRVSPSLVPSFDTHIRNGDPTSIKIHTTSGTSGRICTLTVGQSVYQGLLLDLPRHVETYKTLDSQQYFKTNDIGQILIIFEDITELNKYKDRDTYPDGLTPPMAGAYESYLRSSESLTHLPAKDVSAIESIIFNKGTAEFCFDEVIEEEPHMASFGPTEVVTQTKEKRRSVAV